MAAYLPLSLIHICFHALELAGQVQIAEECLERGGAAIIGRIGVFRGRLVGVSGAAHHGGLVLSQAVLDAREGAALGAGPHPGHGGPVQLLHAAAGFDQLLAHEQIPQRIAQVGQLQRTGQLTLLHDVVHELTSGA